MSTPDRHSCHAPGCSGDASRHLRDAARPPFGLSTSPSMFLNEQRNEVTNREALSRALNIASSDEGDQGSPRAHTPSTTSGGGTPCPPLEEYSRGNNASRVHESIITLRDEIPAVTGDEPHGIMPYLGLVLQVAIVFELRDPEILLLLDSRIKEETTAKMIVQTGMTLGENWRKVFKYLLQKFPNEEYVQGRLTYGTALAEYNEYQGQRTRSGARTTTPASLIMHIHSLASNLTNAAADPHREEMIYVRTRDKLLALVPLLESFVFSFETDASIQGKNKLGEFVTKILLRHSGTITRYLNYTQ